MFTPRFCFLLSLLCVLPFVVQAASSNRISSGTINIKGPLTDEDVAKIRALKDWPFVMVDVGAADDATFASLVALPEARLLSVRNGGNTTTLEPLTRMPDLVQFYAGMRQLTKDGPLDLGPLAKCVRLVDFGAGDQLVSNVEALAACQNLRRISLHQTDVDSLEFLRSTPLVEDLDVSGMKQRFPSYEPVATLRHLRVLSISGNTQATDQTLQALAGLRSLVKFKAATVGQITSLEFLADCSQLEEVDVKWSKRVASLQGLAGLKYLESVDVDSSQVADLSPLQGAPRLRRLVINKTQIADLGVLAGLPALSTLEMRGTMVSDLSPLRSLDTLTKLDIGGSKVTDLKPLSGLRFLSQLSLDDTAVTDLSPLSALDQLESLSLTKTAVRDLAPLHYMPNLKTVTLSAGIGNEQINAFRQTLPYLRVNVR